jgi:5-formyltetrahydrofolate cyclo-ligase
MEPADLKATLRASIRKARLHRSERGRIDAARKMRTHVLALPGSAEFTCVSVYASRPHEPGTLPLIDALHKRGATVLIPSLGDGLERGWIVYRDSKDLVERAPGRPPEPSGEFLPFEALADAQLVVTPALAVDSAGTRLGQGGGWYDRALLQVNPQAVVVTMVYDNELYDAQHNPLPREPHDIPVGLAITPSQVVALGE